MINFLLIKQVVYFPDVYIIPIYIPYIQTSKVNSLHQNMKKNLYPHVRKSTVAEIQLKKLLVENKKVIFII